MDSNKKSKFFKSVQGEENSDGENEKESEDIIEELSKIPKYAPKSSLFNIPKGNEPKTRISKYETIDWNNYFNNKFLINDEIPVYWKGESGPNLVCLHGAGHSGLSFAPLSAVNDKYRVISFDYRGHGFNTMSQGEDLSLETLIKDTIQVLQYIESLFPGESIILIGHSMGGSIATKTLAEIFKNKDKYPSLFDLIQGLIVVDVVEGTAMEALPFMESIVKSRPKSFKSVENAVEFMYKSGTIKSINSARISVPPLLKENENKTFSWKTNLLSSQKYWTGLTKCFLSIKIPKILLLAASDRMDKDLTIAQMQGKFKLSVINNVGHLVHEDDPSATFNIVDKFITTFRITSKISEIQPIIGKLGSNKPNIIKYEEYI